MRPNWQVVLETLYDGSPVLIGDKEYYLSEDLDLCVKRARYKDDKYVGTCYLRTPWDLGAFLRACDRMSTEEAFLQSTRTVELYTDEKEVEG